MSSDTVTTSTKAMGSRLFAPYCTIGYVSDGNPLKLHNIGNQVFVTMSIGKCFHVLRYDSLVPVLKSDLLDEPIVDLHTVFHTTFVNTDRNVHVFHRNRHVKLLGSHEGSIRSSILVGEMIMTVCSEGFVKIWDKNGCLSTLQLIVDKRIPTCISHPLTYLNKIVIGYSDGVFELWDIKAKKLLFEYAYPASQVTGIKRKRADDDDSSKHSDLRSIRCIQQSPAIDVVAIGFDNGLIALFNLATNTVLSSFTQFGGAVTSLSFRSDVVVADGPALLVSASVAGHLNFWDLKTMQLFNSIRHAHGGYISQCLFLHDEPVLVTNSVDNSIKMWIFDCPDYSCRLLKSRQGHGFPPTMIRYFGGRTSAQQINSFGDDVDASGCQILSASAGDGSFRMSNTARAQQTCELSQSQLTKSSSLLGKFSRSNGLRLGPMIGCSSCETRQDDNDDWPTIASFHVGDNSVYLWSTKTKSIVDRVLSVNDDDGGGSMSTRLNSSVTSVAMTNCGNYCLVGTKGGKIYKFNVQSGQLRAQFPSSSGHQMAVTGLHVNSFNSSFISCSLDCRILSWSLSSSSSPSVVCLELPSPISRSDYLKSSSLLAVACDDYKVHLIDVVACRIIRVFAAGHTNQVTDLAFSNNGFRLYSASLDSTIRVWDIPTGLCVDWIRFSSPPLSLSPSLSGEYMAVVCDQEIDIKLYLDKSLYESVKGVGIDEEGGPFDIDVARPVEMMIEDDDDDDDDLSTMTYNNNDHMLLLSSSSRGYWSLLLDFDAITARRKPVVTLSKTEALPFFLTSILEAADTGGTATGQVDDGEGDAKMMKSIDQDRLKQLLQQFDEDNDDGQLMEFFKLMSHSQIDVELRMLGSPELINLEHEKKKNDDDDDVLVTMIKFFISTFRTMKDVDVAQALLARFLTIHALKLMANPALKVWLTKLRVVQSHIHEKIHKDIHKTSCLVKFMTGLPPT